MQTLAELSECFQLYAVCDQCQRVARVDINTLMEKEGGDYPIDRIRMRLYCTTCRKRTQALRIVYVGPGGKAAHFRYR